VSAGGQNLLAATGHFHVRQWAVFHVRRQAVLPVVGAASVIAAGVGKEPKYQQFLRNPVSRYGGDISYSLYLVHWPVIVILGAVMEPSPYYYLTVVTASSALAIASYYLVENPLRRITMDKFREVTHQIFVGEYWPAKTSQYAMVGATALLVVALCGYVVQPMKSSAAPADLTVTANSANAVETVKPILPPLPAALNNDSPLHSKPRTSRSSILPWTRWWARARRPHPKSRDVNTIPVQPRTSAPGARHQPRRA
jgi:hypothetical protein